MSLHISTTPFAHLMSALLCRRSIVVRSFDGVPLNLSVFCFVVSVGEGLVSKPKSKMPKTGDSNAQGRQVSSLLSLAYYHLLQINY